MAGVLLRRKLFNFFQNVGQRSRSLVAIANKPRLPGSTGANFPKHLSPPKEQFPIITTAESVDISSKATASECAAAVKEQFQSTLNKHGAVLYRGFPLEGYKDFASFYHGLARFEAMEYIGGAAPRTSVGDGVYTASDEPPELSIEPHNEMAYMHIWPDVVRTGVIFGLCMLLICINFRTYTRSILYSVSTA